MNKKFYLQTAGNQGEYSIWQAIETTKLYGQSCTRCLLVANEQFPIVSQADAPYTALFSDKAIAEFVPVN